ncbi:unnamed protein product, partial [Mesorhabditis spiculigera]
MTPDKQRGSSNLGKRVIFQQIKTDLADSPHSNDYNPQIQTNLDITADSKPALATLSPLKSSLSTNPSPNNNTSQADNSWSSTSSENTALHTTATSQTTLPVSLSGTTATINSYYPFYPSSYYPQVFDPTYQYYANQYPATSYGTTTNYSGFFTGSTQ